MKKYLKKIGMGTKAIYHAFWIICSKSRRLDNALELGNMMTEIQAAKLALDKIKTNEKSKQLIEQRFSEGIPPLDILKTYPKDSLGYGFYKMMTEENLDLFPFKDKTQLNELEYIRERRREIHDLLHVALGYDTTLEGEAALNAFLSAQSGAPDCTLVPVGVILKTIFKQPARLFPLVENIFSAWTRGKSSSCPFSIKWEYHLQDSIEEVQRLICGTSPRTYPMIIR